MELTYRLADVNLKKARRSRRVYKEKQNIVKNKTIYKRSKNGMGITDVLALLGGLALFFIRNADDEHGIGSSSRQPDEVDP